MRQTAWLELARVAQQRASGADGRTIVCTDAQPIERRDAVGARQVFARELRVELPSLACRHGADGRRHWMIGRNDEPAGFVARQRRFDVSRGDDLEDQLAGGDVEGSEPRGRAARIHCDDVVISVSDEPVVREHRAGRHRLDHGSADDALGQLGIFDLLTDRDAVPLGDEPPQVLGGGFHGNTRERDLRRAAVIARREREPQLARGELGIVLEHLVEIAHPEKQDGLGVAGLDVTVLLHERGLGHRRHGSSTTKGRPPTFCFSRDCARCAS